MSDQKTTDRRKIEAGAVVCDGSEGVQTTVEAMLSNGHVAGDDNFIYDVNELTLVESAELRPGCTVRHDDGSEGYVYPRYGEYLVQWANGVAMGVAADRLTILRQPEPVYMFDRPVKRGVDINAELVSELVSELAGDLSRDTPFDATPYLGLPNATVRRIEALHRAHIAARNAKRQ